MNKLKSAAWTTRASAVCYVVALLSASQAFASDAEGWRVSGFGTLGHVWDNRNSMATTREVNQRPDNGYKAGSSWKMDSRLGVQVEYRFNDVADVVVQSVLRDQERMTFDSALELAYLSLKPNARLDLRFGRVGFDAFLMSDHRNVGYAYAWSRPPVEFYGWIPIFSVDGADAAYRFEAADVRWRLKAQAGRSHVSLPVASETFDFETHDLWSLSLSGETGDWRFKAALAGLSMASELDSLQPLHRGLGQVAQATRFAFPAISAEATSLNKGAQFKGAHIGYASLGAAYDDGTWFGQGEMGRSDSSSSVGGESHMAYLGFGRRFGDWAPYVMWSGIRPRHDRHEPEVNWSMIGQQGLQGKALGAVNATRMEQQTVTLGTRWDFHPQAALKMAWSSTKVQPYGYALWYRDVRFDGRSSRIDMLSVSLDFTF